MSFQHATRPVEAGSPNARLLEWLDRQGIHYEVVEHPLTFTARETARAEGIDPRRFAKTLAVATSDGRWALVVLDAVDQLDLVRARRVLNSGHVRLLTEDELQGVAPDFEVGTMPPVGELFGVTVFADFAIREDPEISFHAGSHRYTIHVDRAAWETAAGVTYGDLAMDADLAPQWARS